MPSVKVINIQRALFVAFTDIGPNPVILSQWSYFELTLMRLRVECNLPSNLLNNSVRGRQVVVFPF